MTKRELYYSLRSAYRLASREFVHGGTLAQPMNLLGLLRKLTGDWFAGLGRPGYWSEPSYEVMFWQERDACDRIQREMQSKIDDLRMRMDAARGLLAPLGNQPIPSVMAIREALNILR